MGWGGTGDVAQSPGEAPGVEHGLVVHGWRAGCNLSTPRQTTHSSSSLGPNATALSGALVAVSLLYSPCAPCPPAHQDYNQVVLRRLTIPNVIANMERLPRARPRPSSRYFAGDWRAVGEHLTGCGYGGHYDLILSSETIYSVAAQERLLECIKQVGGRAGIRSLGAGVVQCSLSGGRCSFHGHAARTVMQLANGRQRTPSAIRLLAKSAAHGESRSGLSVGIEVLE